MKLTTAKIERLRKALDAVAECDELRQSYQQSPLAHDVRASISRARGLCTDLEQLRRNGRLNLGAS